MSTEDSAPTRLEEEEEEGAAQPNTAGSVRRRTTVDTEAPSSSESSSDEEEDDDHKAHVVAASGSFAFIVGPIFNVLEKVIPSKIRGPVFEGWHWVMTHKKLVVLVLSILFTILLVFIPNTFLPHSKEEEVAEDITSAYCNQSIVKKFLDERLDQFGSKIGQDLPTIDTDYLNGLVSYTCNVPKKEALLLWAPPGYGMNKGLHEMVLLWQKQGRVVIHVDLHDFTGGSSELAKLIHAAVLEGFQDQDLYGSSIRGLNSFLSQAGVDEDDEVKVEDSSWFTIIRQMSMKALSFIPLISESLKTRLSTFYDNKLANLDIFISSLISADEEALTAINLRTLFTAMEILARSQPRFAPVIIFDHLEVLSELGDSQMMAFFKKLLNILEKHEEAENVVPVILASKDTLWFYKTEIFQTQGVFIPYRVAQLSEEDASKVLVDVLKVWTKEEFSKVFTAVGGHSASIDEIYKYNKFFAQTIDEAIASEAGNSQSTILSAVSKAGNSRAADIFEELTANDFELALEGLDQVTPAMEVLMHAGILYLDNGLKVKPVCKGMKAAIQRYQNESSSAKRK